MHRDFIFRPFKPGALFDLLEALTEIHNQL